MSSWFSRLREGLTKTSSGLSSGISDIFTKRKLDDAMLEELEELLIASDIGAATAAQIAADFGEGRFDKEITPDEVKTALADSVAAILAPVTAALNIDTQHQPHVVLVVGVNGNGKTTTIGKMAHLLKGNGYSVMLAAADTFRAAAVEQLNVWATRVGCPIVTGAEQADPASVAFQAVEKAKAQGVDVLLIDTAGRLHNKSNLMDELKKIVRVIQKVMPDAPHSVVQVLDGTTGQNALQQVSAFKELVDVSGLVVTKLDGTSKAGVVVTLAKQFGLPIHAIGVGEGIDDLKPFDASEFSRSLVGAA